MTCTLARARTPSPPAVGSGEYTKTVMNANSPFPVVCQAPQGCISGGTTMGGAPVPVAQRVLVSRQARCTALPLRPNPYVGNGTSWFDQGTSSYHALNFSLVERIRHGPETDYLH